MSTQAVNFVKIGPLNSEVTKLKTKVTASKHNSPPEAQPCQRQAGLAKLYSIMTAIATVTWQKIRHLTLKLFKDYTVKEH